NVEIVVKIAVVGRNPREVPTHSLAKRFNFVDRGSRHSCIREIVIFEMRKQALDVVDFERAPDALARLAGPHHEVLDEELAATVEQLCERNLSGWSVKDVLLLDPDPRQRALFRVELVAQFGECFFFGEQSGARFEPFAARDNGMRCKSVNSAACLSS